MRHRKNPPTSPSGYGDGGNVGYGRPPVQHRFKPGQSGNPKGRPKGRKNEATIWIESALKGDSRSAAFILSRLQGLELVESSTDHLSDDDRTILEAYSKAILDQSKKAR
jgi:hypothetical protein